MKKHFLNKAIRILLATNALILMAGAMLGPIYALFVEKIGGDLMDASIAGGIFALAAGIATLISGRYSDKLRNSELIMVIGYCIMGAGFLSYIWVDSLWTLFAVQAVIGLGEAIYVPAFDMVYTRHISKNKLGSIWGAWESMNYFTSAFGAVIGGILVTQFSFSLLFCVMAGLCFASAIYIYHLKRSVL